MILFDKKPSNVAHRPITRFEFTLLISYFPIYFGPKNAKINRSVFV